MKELIEHEFRDLPEKYRTVIPKSDHVLFVEPTAGCTSGTRGRVAVMEAIEMNAEIQDLILKSANEDEILAAARRNGFISMKEDALIKTLEHTIPFEEMNTLGGELTISDEAEKEGEELKRKSEEEIEEGEASVEHKSEEEAPVDNQEKLTV
jgi:hypothetical protein